MLIKTQDIKTIKALDDQIFNSSSYSEATYKQMLASNDFYFITQDGESVGFVITQRVGDEYELIKVGILKPYRRQGLTYGALLELLGTLSYERFLLEVRGHNYEAIELYLKLGFEVMHIRKDYYCPGVDAVLMQYRRT